MLKNEILNIDGRNWLVREANSELCARNAIATARASGSIGAKETVNNDGDVMVLADVVRLNDDNTECLPYGEKGGTDHSEQVALAAAKKVAAEADPHRVAACLTAFDGFETQAIVSLIDLGGVCALAGQITRNSDDEAKLGRALEQSNLRGRINAGALAQIEAWATSDDPIYSDAAFLRQIIAKEIAEARATIADARKAAMIGSLL